MNGPGLGLEDLFKMQVFRPQLLLADFHTDCNLNWLKSVLS